MTIRTPVGPGSLVHRIEAAFEHTSLPLDAEISMPTYDDEGTAAYFRGKTWRGHTARQLRRLDFSLTVMTAEAFAYFLPAYMLADIKQPEDADTISEALLFHLSPNIAANEQRCRRIVTLLSQPQREAVAEYFEHVRQRDGECEEGEFEDALRLLRS